MSNVDYYNQLLRKRKNLDSQTEAMEKRVFSIDNPASIEYIQKWHRLEIDRRHLCYRIAVAWASLSRDERQELSLQYQNQK